MNSSFFLPIAVCLLLSIPLPSFSSVLGDSAAAMKPGEWRKLTTGNIQSVLGESDPDGASGGITGYAEGGAWNPAAEEFLFIGGDHFYGGGGYSKYVAYSAATNSWRELTRPSWFGFHVSGAMHGYDHTALNPANGDLYHRPFGSNANTFRKQSGATGQWSTIPGIPSTYTYSDYLVCCAGLAYFPEAGGLIFANGLAMSGATSGTVYLFRESTQQWTRLANNLTYNTTGEYETTAEYNPAQKFVYFGGAGAFLYKADSAGTVTRLANPPITLGDGSAISTVDPVSGEFLAFGSNGSFHAYNPATNTWSQQPGSNFFDPILGGGSSHIWEVVAAPVPNHGVVFFAKSNGSSSSVYLYKHKAAATGEEGKGQRANGKERINIIPNPARKAVSFSASGGSAISDKGAEFTVHDAAGRLIRKWVVNSQPGGRSAAMDVSSLPAGVYVAQVMTGAVKVSKKFIVTR